MVDFALEELVKILERPRTFSELLSLTKLPERTLRYKLKKLKELGKVRELPNLKDMRSKYFVAL